jgi:NAD(P)-dependent dehydrogenase (short-subunit alcohol dehydrogenase family)
VPRIFITGSTDGLGRAAADALISEGHDVVLHARSRERLAALGNLAADSAGVVIGDLSSATETRDLAGQVNQIGRSWNAAQAYSESKLYVTALALTIARVWPDVLSNAVDPGWVPTKMGGPAATGNLKTGYLTQTWLAVSDDAAATVSGGYWNHRQRQAPAAQARDQAFQNQLMDRLAELTGVTLF